MTPGDAELHTLAGAYVLDAVSPGERARFAAHLADCAECRAEIAELREAAARLGTAQAVRPRPGLREPVITAARRTGQLAPVTGAMPETDARDAGGRRSQAVRALSAAAAVIAVAAGVGLGTHYADQSGEQAKRTGHMVTAVLGAPDAVMRSAPVRTGGMAVVVTSRRERMGVFMARGLRPLPRARCYELWLMGPGGERPAGRLTVHASGMAGPALIPGMAAGDMVGLTVEPASGSLKPTSPPLVMVGRRSG